MKARFVLGVLLCGALWGLCEALLGEWMYGSSAVMRGAAPVVLSVIGFAVLAAGRAYVPVAGSSSAVGALAALFKALNTEFACHLLAIFLLGASFDVVYSLARGRGKPWIGLAATYLGFAAFALTITYVFRYSYWVSGGWMKILGYVGLAGTVTAVLNMTAVPLADWLARALATRGALRPSWRVWGFRAACAATMVLWGLAIAEQI